MAEDWLIEDASRACAWALRMSPSLDESEDRLAAIADFIFNLGPGRYKISTLRKRVDAGDWGSAREEVTKWVWGNGKRLPGLVIRRNVESELMR